MWNLEFNFVTSTSPISNSIAEVFLHVLIFASSSPLLKFAGKKIPRENFYIYISCGTKKKCVTFKKVLNNVF